MEEITGFNDLTLQEGIYFLNYKTEQEAFWASDFGNEYIQRKQGEDEKRKKIFLWSILMSNLPKVDSIFEFGCNIGLNLKAINYLQPEIVLRGIDINKLAVRQASKSNIGHIKEGSITEPLKLPKTDLVFTFGVLIHVNPDKLEAAYSNLFETSKKYILVAEYFNPTPIEVDYRGHRGKLFKRDFSGDLMDLYDLNLVNYGFFYKNDKKTAQDNLNWFLLEKKIPRA